MSRFFKAEISSSAIINSDFCLLGVKPSGDYVKPDPGQFYMLQATSCYDPLLKRPFSIFSIKNNELGFLFRVRGKATKILSSLKEGETIDLIGPLGSGYPEPASDFVAVAGGVGVASLYSLIEKYSGRAHFFYGARTKDELVLIDEIRALSKELTIVTQDCSCGIEGVVTDACADAICIPDSALKGFPVYACGPNPMLKALHGRLNDRDIKCYVSLEEHMACGVGACLGCVVKGINEYKRVCKEGPVFPMDVIQW
ncbi:MAG: dihydroorotate dehydrogenase electron transfer subunit [Dissulfurispiraceae bacterium]|nr:dihydroorotate dehydrogenase electron transfer subunit [Dissulfurispiraceae bacterium]